MTSLASCSTAVKPVLGSEREGVEEQSVSVNECVRPVCMCVCVCLYNMMEWLVSGCILSTSHSCEELFMCVDCSCMLGDNGGCAFLCPVSQKKICLHAKNVFS